MGSPPRMNMDFDPLVAVTGTVVEARAPGKVIICGEHAVVHGTGAVAAALNRYTVVRINRPPDQPGNLGYLSLHLLDFESHLSWKVEYITECFAPLELAPGTVPSDDAKETLRKLAGEFVDKHVVGKGIDRGASAGVQAFFVMYFSILGLQPLEVVVHSELPVGAGLGSSAAFCVSLSAALLTLAGQLRFNSHESRWSDINDTDLDRVNSWAFEGEKSYTANLLAWTIRSAAMVRVRHVVHFKKGQIARIEHSSELKMLLTNTKVSRNTKKLVAGVGERTMRHPEAMAAVFRAVDAISDEVVQVLESPEVKSNGSDIHLSPKDEERRNEERKYAASLFLSEDMIINTSKTDGNKPRPPTTRTQSPRHLTRLEELICMNQGLLQCMGVSHPSIEHICQITSEFNLCSKLTGAGGGGCVFTLLRDEQTDTTKVTHRLQLAGFDCFEAVMGGKGVQVGYRSSLLPSPHGALCSME